MTLFYAKRAAVWQQAAIGLAAAVAYVPLEVKSALSAGMDANDFHEARLYIDSATQCSNWKSQLPRPGGAAYRAQHQCPYAHRAQHQCCHMLPIIDALQEIEEGVDIVYTYDVHWQPSQIKWASRWDAYLRMPGGRVRLQSEFFLFCVASPQILL